MPFPTSIDVNDWSYFILNGVPSPGSIPRSAFRGFVRETGWDEQHGKGTKGATLVLSKMPPAKGSITLQLIGPGGFYAAGGSSTDFAQWDNFVANVLSIDPAKQKAEGLAIAHPQLASVGITSVVVKSYGGPEHIGKGLYQVTIELIEWVSPPATSVVSTVSTQAQDFSDAAVPFSSIGGQDPEVKSLEAQIAAGRQATVP